MRWLATKRIAEAALAFVAHAIFAGPFVAIADLTGLI